MQRSCLTLCVMISSLVVALDATANAETKNVPQIGIVGVEEVGWKYLGKASKENLTRLKNVGVNTIVIWVGYPRKPFTKPEWWNDSEVISLLSDVGTQCRKLNLDLYLMTYMGLGIYAYPHVKIAASMDMDGVGGSAPSWFDPVYWNTIIIPRDRQLAKLAKRGLIKGVLMEPEVYQPGALMERGQLDFCDVAWKRFAQQIGLKGEVPKVKERAKYLLTTGLIGAYYVWQEQDLLEHSRQRAEILRKEAPSIQLGYYSPGAWQSAWPLRSLARGMNSVKTPMLILDASTYPAIGKNWQLNWEEPSIKKYSLLIDNLVKGWGLNAHVAFGIYTYPNGPGYIKEPFWERCRNPEKITQFLRDTVDAGNGWWIYNEAEDPNTLINHIRESNR